MTRTRLSKPVSRCSPHWGWRRRISAMAARPQQLGMVEAPLPLLGGVHRHRNHRHLRSNSKKGFDAICQEHTQTAGNRLHAAVLE